MLIPPHVVEQIRAATDIVALIGEVVHLKQRGRNYIGLCPFHNEKTPSFNVQQDKGIFKCFGCGKGGDSLTFVMEHRKQSFTEAAAFLAERAGISLQEYENEKADSSSAEQWKSISEALREAAEFYQARLQRQEGLPAREYIQQRGFLPETCAAFALGFAPDGWSNVCDTLRDLGFEQADLIAAGLAKENDRGGVYDVFRGRLMFPIHNVTGKIVGFGARRLNEDKSQPKYINSPQTVLYDKSKILYGLFQAKETIRKQGFALLAEGYADVIALHQAGFSNAVASSGTALTKEQLTLLRRYTDKLTVVYDADAAGINAALRGIDLAVEEGFDVAALRLPEGEDPDSFIRTQGKEAFAAVIQKAQPLLEFKADILLQLSGNDTSAMAQAALIRGLLETVAKVPDQLKRELLLRSVALRFSLDERLLAQELQSLILKSAPPEQRRQQHLPLQQQPLQEPFSQKNALPQSKPQPRLLPEEQELLFATLAYPGALSYLLLKMNLNEKDFVSTHAEEVFYLMKEHSHEGKAPGEIILAKPDLPDELRSLITEVLAGQQKPSEHWKRFEVEIQENLVKAVADSVFSLRIKKAKTRVQTLQIALQEASEGETQAIFTEIIQLQRSIRQWQGYIAGETP